MGHTQTKLCISSESQTTIKCADFMGETSVLFASAHGYNGSGFFPPDDEAPHNARRLVACWNACDGVPTDALEQIEGFGKAALPYHQLKAQRDALLEALKALRSVEFGHSEDDICSVRIAADAAIAAAEKGGT